MGVDYHTCEICNEAVNENCIHGWFVIFLNKLADYESIKKNIKKDKKHYNKTKDLISDMFHKDGIEHKEYEMTICHDCIPEKDAVSVECGEYYSVFHPKYQLKEREVTKTVYYLEKKK